MKVIVYGAHSQDWMSALAPEAQVWKQLPQVESVTHLVEGQEAPHYLIKDSKNVVLIPLMETHRYAMPTEFNSLTSPVGTIQTLSNKRFYQLAMREKGFAEYVPEYWSQEHDPIFPCLIKRENLNAGNGVSWIENIEELNRIRQDPIFSGQSYFFEEVIQGEEEFVTHLVAKNGNILLTHTFCYSMGNDKIRVPGNFQKIRHVDIPMRLKIIFEAIMKSFDYSGPANIDYKINNGIPKIFEINPRMGGSLMMPDHLPFLIDVTGALIDNAIYSLDD